MKIAFFTQNIKKGGLDTFILNLIGNLPINFEVVLFCNASHPGLNDLAEALGSDRRISIIAYDFLIAQDIKEKFKNFPYFYLVLFKVFFWLFGPIYQILRIKKLYKKYKPNYLMVINGGYPGGDACLMASLAWKIYNPKVPSWHNFHNLVLPYSVNPIRKIREWVIDCLMASSVCGFVTVSKTCLNTLRVRPIFNGCIKAFIYNGIGLQKSNLGNNGNIREEFCLPLNCKILLMLAVHEPRKGQQFIIDCMDDVVSRYPNAYLLICGDGTDDEIKHTMSIKNHSSVSSNVLVLDHRADSVNLIRQADIVVMPSQGAESFGYAAVEAMANAKPVIVTNIGGLPEVVENGVTGYVVDVANNKEFSDRVVELLGNSVLSSNMGREGLLRVLDKFSGEKMSNQYLSLILGDNVNVQLTESTTRGH